jgi:hypothetical protein
LRLPAAGLISTPVLLDPGFRQGTTCEELCSPAKAGVQFQRDSLGVVVRPCTARDIRRRGSAVRRIGRPFADWFRRRVDCRAPSVAAGPIRKSATRDTNF